MPASLCWPPLAAFLVRAKRSADATAPPLESLRHGDESLPLRVPAAFEVGDWRHTFTSEGDLSLV